MTLARLAAAAAAVLTALLVQASLVAPVFGNSLLSLPAVLVAAVALRNGPGAAISVGFVSGLLADLGSAHPAGVLALTWLGLGLAAARLAGISRGRRADVLLVTGLGVAAAIIAALLLTALGTAGSTLGSTADDLLPALVGYLLLAAILVPLVTAASASVALRPTPGAGPPPTQGPVRPLGLARSGRPR